MARRAKSKTKFTSGDHRLGSRRHVQGAQYRRGVRFNGAGGKIQVAANHFARLALQNQEQDFGLTRAQAQVTRVFVALR